MGGLSPGTLPKLPSCCSLCMCAAASELGAALLSCCSLRPQKPPYCRERGSTGLRPLSLQRREQVRGKPQGQDKKPSPRPPARFRRRKAREG